MTLDEGRELIRLREQAADAASAYGFRSYLERVVVDSRPIPLPFGMIAEPWQWERAAAIRPAINWTAGLAKGYTGPKNFWFGYSKGHDKTSFVARTFNWLLAYSKRPLRLYAAAADLDQAALIKRAMEGELALNPWLAARVQIQDRHAYGIDGSEMEILASDADSAQGKIPDVVCLDEITHWRSNEMFEALWSARDKRKECIFLILSNAGWRGTWQWDLRNYVASSPAWRFFEQAKGVQLASWMNAEEIAENRKPLTKSEARRLLDNEWIDPGEEDGYVSLSEAEACVDPGLEERTNGEWGQSYWAIVDYGKLNDRTALCVLHNPPGTLEIVVDRLDCWQGTRDEPVQIERVDGWLEEVRSRYNLAGMLFDVFQMEHTAQKFSRLGENVVLFEYLAGKNNYRIAQLLKSLIATRKIRWSSKAGLLPGAEDSTFAIELARLVVKQLAYGYRFDHEHGAHDDRTVAVAMGCLHALEKGSPAEQGPTVVKRDAYSAPANQSGVGFATNWGQKRGMFGM